MQLPDIIYETGKQNMQVLRNTYIIQGSISQKNKSFNTHYRQMPT